MSHPDRCPVHASKQYPELNAWPCPDECPDFLAELEHRIEDVQVHGNFVRTWRADDGTFYKQHYRDHQPVAEPISWTVMNDARPGDRVEDLD